MSRSRNRTPDIDWPIQPTVGELRDFFSPQTWTRGEDYQRRGRVHDMDMDEDEGMGLLLAGLVDGSGGNIYETLVVLARFDGALALGGHCACPVGAGCKHQAAVLLQALRRGWFEPGGAPPVSRAAPALTRPAAAPARSQQPLDPLAGPLNAWLDALGAAAGETAAPAPAAGRKPPSAPAMESILYFLDAATYPSGLDYTRLTVQASRPLKSGGWGAGRSYSVDQMAQSTARMVTDADRAIGRVLTAGGYRSYSGMGELAGDAATLEWAVERIIASGRAYWRDRDGPRLTRGPDQPGRIGWRLTTQGEQAPMLTAEDPALTVLSGPCPWVVNPVSGETGRLTLDLAPEVLKAFLDAPPVPPEAAAALADAMRRRFPDLPIAPPRQDVAVTVDDSPPVPVLRLSSHKPSQAYQYVTVKRARQEEWVDAARLSFDYGVAEIPAGAPPADLRRVEGGAVTVRRRRMDVEKAALQNLHDLGLSAPDFHMDHRISHELGRGGMTFPFGANAAAHGALRDDGPAWPEFMHLYVPQLRAAGWRVEVDDDFRHRMVAADGEWQAEIEDKGGWWFSLDLGIEVEGQRIPLLPVLISALSRLKPGQPLDQLAKSGTIYGQMADGRTLALPFDRVRQLVEVLVELFGDRPPGDSAHLDLSLAQAVGLEAIADATRMRLIGGERLRRLARQLRDDGVRADCPVPAGFQAELRPYQHLGYSWLQFLAEQGLGGILADDMGLGKTVQTLAHILAEKESGRMETPFLVVAPTSLVPTWREEAARFAPALRVLVMHGLNRPRSADAFTDVDLVVTTYPLLTRDEALLGKVDWHGVALDEAQAIKNPATKWTQIACKLKAGHRLCLTGTPVENHLGEAWSQFAFLMPGLLGDNRTFTKVFRTPIEKKNDGERRGLLARRLKPFLLRRTKAEVAAELPPKTEVVRHVELSGAQRDLYETLRLTMDSKVREAVAAKGLSRSAIVILEALLKLRQACCDPRLVKLRGAKKSEAESAKLTHLMEFLPELVEEGRRVLLFSQFTSMLDLIKPELNAAGIPFVELTGDTVDRSAPVKAFQAGQIPVFLISLKAGGVGLTLTAADTVIHYDPWWNPAVEDQATDRAHRIGQDKPVFVYKLIASGTVEERMLELQARKRAMAAALFDPDSDGPMSFTEEDLAALFQPLG